MRSSFLGRVKILGIQLEPSAQPTIGTGVQVTDAETKTPLAGVKVSIVLGDAVLGTLYTDPYGNADFSQNSPPGLSEKVQHDEDLSKLKYKVEFQKYQTVELAFVSRQMIPVALNLLWYYKIPTWGWIVGGVGAAAVGGGIIFAAVKK